MRYLPGVAPFGLTFLRLFAQHADDLGPSFVPAIIADDIAQRQHRIDMRSGPVHPAPFQACFHDQFIGALHGAIANRPTRRQEGRILHLRYALVQIG